MTSDDDFKAEVLCCIQHCRHVFCEQEGHLIGPEQVTEHWKIIKWNAKGLRKLTSRKTSKPLSRAETDKLLFTTRCQASHAFR